MTKEKILNEVAKYYKLDPDQIRNKDQRIHIIIPRKIAINLIWKHCNLSQRQIGIYFGGRASCTIFGIINSSIHLKQIDEYTRDIVEEIESRLINNQ